MSNETFDGSPEGQPAAGGIGATTKPDDDRPIARRKVEHLDIVLNRDIRSGTTTTGLEAVRFAHHALPDLDLVKIDLGTRFVGRDVRAPILISSMTGGPAQSRSINENIAEAAQTLGLAFGVGSQRIALEEGQRAGFDRRLRRVAKDVPILANFGAGQLRTWDGVEMARRAVDMIEADALIIHLNPLQEAVQERGDRDWRGLLAEIERICRHVTFPVVAKEVGCGITGKVARQLVDAGVSVIDVAGAGGTSWAAVEAERGSTPRARATAAVFREWGVPTAQALLQVRQCCPDVDVIASGGLRNGIDCAKAVRLGADMTGLAAGLLAEAVAGPEALIQHLEIVIEQLRIACFCTGSANLASLRSAEVLPQDLGATIATSR
jgi:isopentenyl-diphosphate delta-isomerase